MNSNFQILTLLCITTITIYGQEFPSPVLNIGDPAPPLRVKEWIKGNPIRQFEKGNIYVVEFWATWCVPCIAAMPHLSDLAREYKDRVYILGIDIYEKKTTSLKKIKGFVDSMGHRMDYHVALEDSNFMATGWLDASGELDIPKTFMIDVDGKIAWIGHPSDLSNVLSKIVNNKWSISEALTKRNLNKQLENLDSAAGENLNRYIGDPYKPDDLGKPDSALLMISEIVRNEPRLKYAPRIAFHTFSSLLKTDPKKAYRYGKELLITYTYEDPPYGLIISSIKWYSKKINIPPEIYELGAEAYQAEIDHYPLQMKNSNTYQKMADLYYRAGNKIKAIDAQQKAIDQLKADKNFSVNDLAAFELRLQEYKAGN